MAGGRHDGHNRAGLTAWTSGIPDECQARHADAVVQRTEGEGGLRVSIVLNRVPSGAEAEICADLPRSCSDEEAWARSHHNTEQSLTDGRLPIDVIYPVGSGGISTMRRAR